MSRPDLTDLQLRQLMTSCDRAAAGRGQFSQVEAGQIRRVIGELQQLRTREAVSHHLHQLEGVY